jgi:hypothetical protein
MSEARGEGSRGGKRLILEEKENFQRPVIAAAGTADGHFYRTNWVALLKRYTQ